MTTALAFESVSFSYGEAPVLSDVTLLVAPGDGVALVGQNGAGKTTLTRLAIGLGRPSTGRVLVGDWDAAGRRPEQLARRVGYLFQHADRQVFRRTALEDVAFGPLELGVSAADAAARARTALDALGLGAAAGTHPYDLSAAHRKLVALAGVLALEPAVLVLDEPTAGLDGALRALVVRALTDRRAAGAAVLVVTHDLAFAAEALDRVVVLETGRVVANQPLSEWLWNADAIRRSGLAVPPAVALAHGLGMDGRPVRREEIAAKLAERWRGRGARPKFQ
jgi:energy-coupling factor transporter ATP-binding protein EcfA2